MVVAFFPCFLECSRLLKRLDFPEMKFSLYFMGYEVKLLMPLLQESFIIIINSLIIVHVDLFDFFCMLQ